jgi:hypothetical protein
VVFGLTIYYRSRRQGHPAMIVRVALVLVAIRAVVGITSGSARVYLAQEIGIDALLGSGLLLSLLRPRPFAAVLAGEFYPFTDEMRESDTFRSAMATVTAVWGGYFLARASVRLIALLTLQTTSYVLVVALTDVPFLLALLAWSAHHTVGSFRRSPRWAPLIAAAESPAGGPGAGEI